MLVLFLLYTIFLESLYFLTSPILFTVFRMKPGCERLAIGYPRKHFDIIVHAASVGEINGIKQLLLELLNTHPDMCILLTTNTKTGRNSCQEIHPRLFAVLSPLDIFHLRKKQIMLSAPSLILIAETEIWPTLLFIAGIEKIPMIFVNSRISSKAFHSYMVFKPFLRWLGSSIKAICSQTESDCDRFTQLFSSECLVSGNLKFSVKQTDYNRKLTRQKWGYKENDTIIVIGSSRPGEEKLLINSFDSLISEIPELRLIIVPRHLSRLDEIKGFIKERGVSLYSKQEPAKKIHIVDTMGHLTESYAICDIAIIGGSFFPFGGHNPLEAAYYGRPIIIGPYHYSCQNSVKVLKNYEAIILSSTETLTDDIRKIIADIDKYLQYGSRARQVLDDNGDSLIKHLNTINKYLD
jgi:3-deoxy-D-manno-octulosonic-acid transferase